MASRRARIQIKPNIRPAKPATPAAKAGDAGKSKAASTAKTDSKAESSAEPSKSTLKDAAEKGGEKVKSVEALAPASCDQTDSNTGADPSSSGEDISQDVPKAALDGGEEAGNIGSLSSSAEVILSPKDASLPSPGTAAPADSTAPRPSPVQPAPAALSMQEVSDSQAGKAGSVPAITVTAADEPRQELFPSVRSGSPVKRTSGVDVHNDHHDPGVLPKEAAGLSGTAELSDHAHSKGADHSHPHGKSVDHGRSKSADHAHSKSHDHSHGKSLDHGHSKSLIHAHPKTPDHGHSKAFEHGYSRGIDHGAKGPEGIHKVRTEPKRFNVHTIRKRRTPVDKNLLPSTDEPPPKTLKMRELVHWNPKSNPMSSTASGKGKAKKKKKGTETSAETAAKVAALNDFDRNLVPPRVRLGPDGNIALDENIFQERNLVEELPTVEEDENEVLNSHSFRKNRTLTKYWSKRETAKFYIALSMVGTDFTLMQCELFPKRSRKELKNKFKREERSHRNMVDFALKNKQPINKSVFITDEVDEEAEKERKKEERERKRQERLEAQQQQRQEREVKKRQSQAEKAQQPTQSQPSEQRKSGRKRKAVRQDDYIFGDEDEEDMELEEVAAPAAKDPRTEVGEILVKMSQQYQQAASHGGSRTLQPLPSTSATPPRLQKPPSAPPRGPTTITPRSGASLPRLAPSILRKTSQRAGVNTATLTTSQGASSSAASTAVEVLGQNWVPSPQYLLSSNSSGTITHETRDSAGNIFKIEMPQEALMNIDGARMVDQVIMTPQGPSTQRLLLMPEAKQDNCMVHIYVVPQDATISIFQEVDDNTRQRLMDFPPSSLQPSQSGQMHLYNMAYPNSGGTIKAHVHPFTPFVAPATFGAEPQVAATDHSQQQAAGWPGDGQIVQMDQNAAQAPGDAQFVQVDPSAAHVPIKQEGFVREETVTTSGLPGVDGVDFRQVGSATWGVAGTGSAGQTHSALSHEAAPQLPSTASSVSSAVQGPSALSAQPHAPVTNPRSHTEEQCNFLLADDPEGSPPCQQESNVRVASGESSASSKEGSNVCLAKVPNRTASTSEKSSLSVASSSEAECNFLLAGDPNENPSSSNMEVRGDNTPVTGQGGAWPIGCMAGQDGTATLVKEDMEVKPEKQRNGQADSRQTEALPSETAASHPASSSQDMGTTTSPSLR